MEALKRRLAGLKRRLAGEADRPPALRALRAAGWVLLGLVGLPLRLLWALGRWLLNCWRNRPYRRWRDLPIRAAFVVYTLAAFVAGTLVCLLVLTLCNRVRLNLQNKYAQMSVSHVVPERGSYDVHRSGRIVTVTIYDESDSPIEQFTVNLRRETLAYDAEIRTELLHFLRQSLMVSRNVISL